ncbi:MAG TPA: sigma-70 family RNA polymerase sigma factor [Polyangiaceae bacterium]|jgi:RNA polymerase sigma-70 factor (ECF subfamily)|nr:sigma-70 family RNA polymerase sigma factor [Polyangiaceae bacterium]
MAPADRELFDQFRAGDQRAGDLLISRHQLALQGFFARRAPDSARDLAQETWLQCLRSQESYRGEASFRTFLFALAHNVLRYHLRNRAARQLDLSISSLTDSRPSPSSLVHRRFELGVLQLGLAGLDEEHRMLLELTYEEQLTSEQLSELLDVPSATVRTRLRRAKELLRERVEEFTTQDPRLRETSLETLDLWAPLALTQNG